MTNGSSNRVLDELAKLVTDAAGAAQGMRREVETAFRGQAERLLNTMDVVQREDFEAVREMAIRARAENTALLARIEALEALSVKRTRKASQRNPARLPAGPRRTDVDCYRLIQTHRPIASRWVFSFRVFLASHSLLWQFLSVIRPAYRSQFPFSPK